MRTMHRAAVVLAGLGLAIAGTQLAHATAYRLVEPSADARAHMLAGTGHAYLEHASLALALLAVVVLFALISEAQMASAGAGGSALRLWMFGALAPATFVAQEHLERWLHDGAFPWSAVVQPTFLLGLALQIPFALAAYGLARFVLGVTRALARLLLRTPGPRLRSRSVWPRFTSRILFSSTPQSGLGPRGPPLVSV